MKTLPIKERSTITPDKALEILIKGNERFCNNLSFNKNHLEVLAEFSRDQKPFALIISCMDSRAPVEIIFDQGIGDLFSVRVAGNIINEDIIASAEFAVDVVGVKLIMVLGHTNCGAMSACINNIRNGYLKYLVNKIEPNHLKFKNEIDNSVQPINELAKYNAKESANALIDKSEIIQQALKNKKIEIVTAMYSIETGKVDVLEIIK